MTAVANAAFTAAQFNANVRDNLNETAVAKATTAGGIFAATGANAIAQRIPTAATVSTSESTASSTDVNLTTVGPTVTVTTGTQAIVMLATLIQNNTVNGIATMRYEVSGASTISSDDGRAVQFESGVASQRVRASHAHLLTGLTAGSNVFTSKYHTNGTGTATFGGRMLAVFPL
jgi:hypothetical protein